MKKVMKLTESDIHRLVKETINKSLKESYNDGAFKFSNNLGEFDRSMKFRDEYNQETGEIAQDEHPQRDCSFYRSEYVSPWNDIDDIEDLTNDYKNRMFGESKTLSKTYLHKIVNESIKKILKEAESEGWVVEPWEAENAYNMAAAEFGNEDLNAAIVRCMGNDALAKCLAYIFRQYNFRQWADR